MMPTMHDVTHILADIEAGSKQAAEALLPIVYDELRKLAASRMAAERSDHTLQSTALVHEAYVRLVDNDRARHWDSRGHFFSTAAEAMRRILVEHARSKNSLKAGGGRRQVALSSIDPASDAPDIDPLDLLALDESLRKLQDKDPRKAEFVKLRFFAGLSHREAAEALGISSSTADNDWAYAKSWLFVEMSGRENSDSQR